MPESRFGRRLHRPRVARTLSRPKGWKPMTPTTTTWTKLLDLLFEDALVGRCLLAPDGSILRANSEWLRSTGFTREVVGEDIVALFPEVRDMTLALHARARALARATASRFLGTHRP